MQSNSKLIVAILITLHPRVTIPKIPMSVQQSFVFSCTRWNLTKLCTLSFVGNQWPKTHMQNIYAIAFLMGKIHNRFITIHSEFTVITRGMTTIHGAEWRPTTQGRAIIYSPNLITEIQGNFLTHTQTVICPYKRKSLIDKLIRNTVLGKENCINEDRFARHDMVSDIPRHSANVGTFHKTITAQLINSLRQ